MQSGFQFEFMSERELCQDLEGVILACIGAEEEENL